MTMKNYKLIWFGIFCCLQPLILFAQRGETIRKAFLDPKSDQVLVVAHRGNWRSAPENSVAAIDSAIQMGVDIVEIDTALQSAVQISIYFGILFAHFIYTHVF